MTARNPVIITKMMKSNNPDVFVTPHRLHPRLRISLNLAPDSVPAWFARPSSLGSSVQFPSFTARRRAAVGQRASGHHHQSTSQNPAKVRARRHRRWSASRETLALSGLGPNRSASEIHEAQLDEARPASRLEMHPLYLPRTEPPHAWTADRLGPATRRTSCHGHARVVQSKSDSTTLVSRGVGPASYPRRHRAPRFFKSRQF